MTRNLDSDDFRNLFDSVRFTGFRLEALERYTVPSETEDFRAFLDGRPGWEHPVHRSPWLDRLRTMSAAGMRWQRVHVVSRPLSDYVRFEIAGYRVGVDAGEDIRLANRDAYPELAQLTGDFWLFDADTRYAVAVAMRYDEEGRLLGREHVDSPGELESLCEQRDLALRCSQPLRAFLADVEAGHL